MNFKALSAALNDLLGQPADSSEIKHLRRQVFGVITNGVAEAMRKGATRHGSESLQLIMEGVPYLALSKAQLFQDIWAQHELGWKRDGFFVEFGASDGLSNSNTWMLENHFGWRGLLAEPNPDSIESLRTHRKCQISTDCVYPVTGQTVPFRLHDFGEFSGVCADPDAVAKGFRMIEVPTISLNDLLVQQNAPRTIDYMSVDTEGSEFDILSAFDFDAWDVRTLSVEHNYKPVREQIFRLLKSKGYKRRYTEVSQFDDWYVRRD